MKLQLPKFTVDSVHTLEIQASQQRLLTKGICASSFKRAWDLGFTGKDIIVGVVDTGIDSNHNDLKGKVITSINLTRSPVTSGHGTHVAGTIAANGWLLGGAYDCKLIDIKVIDNNGGSIPNIAKAIGLCVSNGASVVNMSLGGTNMSNSDIQLLTSAIQDAWNRGCICVAAAGNDGTSVCTPDQYEYPASIEKTESIAACAIADNINSISLASFSNENNRVDLTACGVNVISTVLNNQYGIYSGTSMATPHVSAMAAILAQFIKQTYPTLSGSSFSANLVSLLHANIMRADGCGSVNINSIGVATKNINGEDNIVHVQNTICPKQLEIGYTSVITGEVSVQYTNISYGLGFLKYQPSLQSIIPQNSSPYINNGIMLGFLI